MDRENSILGVFRKKNIGILEDCKARALLCVKDNLSVYIFENAFLHISYEFRFDFEHIVSMRTINETEFWNQYMLAAEADYIEYYNKIA